MLVTSPHAARTQEKIERARRALHANGADIVHELKIDAVDELPEAVRSHSASHVVAAGGDGTVGAVADQIGNSSTVLLVMPLGTSNDFARSLEIPMHLEDAAALLKRGKVSTIDLGRLEVPGQRPRRFVHAATVGINVNFAKLATRASLRARFGRLTYAVAGALAFHDTKPFNCTLSYGGHKEPFELIQLSVINAPVYGGFLGLRVKGSNPADGVLDVLAASALPSWRTMLAGLYQLLHLKRPVAGVRALYTNQLMVDSDQRLEISLDGEVAAALPCRFGVDGKALRVITPREFEDRGS